MAYANWSHVTGRYKDAATIAGAESVGSYWMAAAEAEVNGRLAARYAVPFMPVPELVRDLTVDLTYYKMIALSERAVPLKQYLDARFADIIAGTLVPVTDDGAVPGAAAGGAAMAWGTHMSYHGPFGPDSPLNWRPSMEEASDAEAER